MDSILAISLGLGLRFLFDVVGQEDVRIEGSLVGLWEGLVLFHFLEKWPTSYDPYFAYAFRLLVDFFLTENIPKLVVIMLWTGVGVVMSDVGPVLWQSTGLRRLYRNLRRDLALTWPFFRYTSSRVRFHSPSRESSDQSPDNLTVPLNTNTPTTLRSRPLPGSFPGDAETETDRSVGDISDESSTDDEAQRNPFSSTMTTSDGSDTDRERGDRTPTNNPLDLPSTATDIPDEYDDEDLYQNEQAPPTIEIPLIPEYLGDVPPAPSSPNPPPSDFSALHAPLPQSPSVRSSFPLTEPEHELPPVPEADEADAAPNTKQRTLRRRPTAARLSVPYTDFSADDSVLSTDDPDELLTRAAALRREAEEEEMQRARLKQLRVQAEKEYRWKDAFKLKLELEKRDKKATKLNERAARRIYKANNASSGSPEVLVVHHLSLAEAMAHIEDRLAELWVDDEKPGPPLHVNVGNGNNIPGELPLRLAIRKRLYDQHIPHDVDRDDPSVLVITPP